MAMLASCAQRIKVPVNRLVSPEAIGRGAEIEYRQTGLSQGFLDFTGSRTTNALRMNSIAERELYMALGISPNADLFYKVPKQSVALFGIKVQVLGGPSKARQAGHKAAFTIGVGSNSDSFEGTYDIDLEANASEFGFMHGYRFSPWLLVYEGLTYSNYSFAGTIKNATSNFSSDEFDYEAKGILGLHAGVELGGESFKLKFEYGAQRIEWSHTEPKYFQSLGYALAITF